MHPHDTLPCFQAHLGLWAIQPAWMEAALWAFQHGRLPAPMPAMPLHEYAQVVAELSCAHFQALGAPVQRKQDALYSQVDGVALVRIVGTMTKVPDYKVGGTSTLVLRQAIRQALQAEDIRSLLVAVDSPGGMVPGTMEAAAAIRQASFTKPVAAFYEDLAASAAVWATAYAQRITANLPAEVGNVGVFARLVDATGAAEREGLKIEVISTGPYKGLGVPGTPITEALRTEVQKMVEGIGAHFFQAMAEGRRFTQGQMAAITTGQVWLAPEAQTLGLIDGVETFDAALMAAARMRPRRRMAAAHQELAQLRAAWERTE